MTSVVSTKLCDLDDSDSEVLLSMFVGEGQMSSSIVRLNDQRLGIDIKDGFQDWKIGKPRDLDNAMLVLDVTVSDFNPHTNDTMIEITLTEGSRQQHQQFSGTAEHHRGTVHYHITYFLRVKR